MAATNTTNRVELIQSIETIRKSRVIVIFLGVKPNLGTQIAMDLPRYVYDHLDNIKKCDNIDVFLFTSGGDTLVPHRLTNLLREHCKKLSILVPSLAASSGTLLCLGLTKLLWVNMVHYPQLTQQQPINSTPTNPLDNNKVIPISVEDVTSFLALADEKAMIRGEAQTLEVFKDLTGQRPLSIHPLALGNVYRALRLIRDLAKKQMLLHENNQEKTQRIIKGLTELLYSHQYLIDREELKRMELKVVNAESYTGLDEIMWNLYKAYEDDIKMLEPFNPAELIANQHTQPEPPILPANLNVQLPTGVTQEQAQLLLQQIQGQLVQPPVTVNFSLPGAYIESTQLAYAFKFEGKITENKKPDNTKEINIDMKSYWQRIR